MTPHINAKKEDIAPIVLAPGDPLRAKYIAENFLDNAILVNTTRNMLAYTGYYNGMRITVFSTGMGMPSMGIYCYELYKYYGVEKIIRIGSCGIYSEDLQLLDTILVDNSYTEGQFAYTFNNETCHFINSSSELNSIIKSISINKNIPLKTGNIFCSEVFDKYVPNLSSLVDRFPKEYNIIGAEMESFALFYIAKTLNKQAACLLTVVDSIYNKKEVSSNDREKSLNDMIILALEACLYYKDNY